MPHYGSGRRCELTDVLAGAVGGPKCVHFHTSIREMGGVGGHPIAVHDLVAQVLHHCARLQGRLPFRLAVLVDVGRREEDGEGTRRVYKCLLDAGDHVSSWIRGRLRRLGLQIP